MSHVVCSKSLTEVAQGAIPIHDCTFSVPCLYMNISAEALDGFTNSFCDCSTALINRILFTRIDLQICNTSVFLMEPAF